MKHVKIKIEVRNEEMELEAKVLLFDVVSDCTAFDILSSQISDVLRKQPEPFRYETGNLPECNSDSEDSPHFGLNGCGTGDKPYQAGIPCR